MRDTIQKMNLNITDLIQPSYRNLKRFAAQSKIILLHPASRFRSLVIARLLNDPDANALYYALDVDDTNLLSFLTGLMRSLAKQRKTFGRRLNLLPGNVLDDPYQHIELLLATVIDELYELEAGEFYLVFDEFDRADLADDVHRFVERLSHLTPQNCTIVLHGRSLPRLPWLSMMAKGHAVILRDDLLVREGFYGRRNDKDTSLKVLSLGPGYVFFDNYLIDNWEGNLPRLLLFFVMDRPEATRNQICEIFWPNLDIDQAVNVFHVTKRRLHKALGMDILSHDGAYYRIDPSIPFYLDAFDFVEALLECRHGAPADPFALWQKVAKLYRGPFLQGHNETWIDERRAAYAVAYVEALENIADMWVERGNDELALMTLTRAIDTDYSCQHLHHKLLRLYTRLGRRAEAVAHFRELEKWAKTNKASLGGDIMQLFADITV